MSENCVCVCVLGGFEDMFGLIKSVFANIEIFVFVEIAILSCFCRNSHFIMTVVCMWSLLGNVRIVKWFRCTYIRNCISLLPQFTSALDMLGWLWKMVSSSVVRGTKRVSGPPRLPGGKNTQGHRDHVLLPALVCPKLKKKIIHILILKN